MRNFVSECVARLDIEDAIELFQQRRAQNVHQLGTVVAHDCVQAPVFLGCVIPPLGRIGPAGFEYMTETRLQLRDQ